MTSAKKFSRAKNAIKLPKKRGRPSNYEKFCRVQGDFFPAEKQAAELLRLPAFRLAAACQDSSAASGNARPQRSEDARPEAALGKPIRIC